MEKKFKVGYPSIVGGNVDIWLCGFKFLPTGCEFIMSKPGQTYPAGTEPPKPLLFTEFEALVLFHLYKLQPVELSDKTIRTQGLKIEP